MLHEHVFSLTCRRIALRHGVSVNGDSIFLAACYIILEHRCFSCRIFLLHRASNLLAQLCILWSVRVGASAKKPIYFCQKWTADLAVLFCIRYAISCSVMLRHIFADLARTQMDEENRTNTSPYLYV